MSELKNSLSMKRLLGLINVGYVHRNIIAFIVYLMFQVFLAELRFSNPIPRSKSKVICSGQWKYYYIKFELLTYK